MSKDPVALAQRLIQFPSITPIDAGVMDFLIELLTSHGFICEKLVFDDTTNLYARFGNEGPNLCFAGHTDVVPPGENWSMDPFSGIIKDGMLYGRGACDMKAAVSAFIAASIDFVSSNSFDGSISFLITGDEEGPATNGTKKILQYLKKKEEILSVCIVGEPTCPNQLGDMIKYGRRGSINFTLNVKGKQGHVAYPNLADNPIDKLILIMVKLKELKLDKGTKDFLPSNLEITNIEANNNATNIIPREAIARFNIRFNDLHTSDSLYKLIKEICGEHDLTYSCSAEAFIGSEESDMLAHLRAAITEITNIEPVLSTTGGTSDARFIKDHCPVVEFGLINKTAHHVDEHVAVQDIIKLKEIYFSFLKRYFK
jgi:succinyl-diaminopimelate desuccinylase